MKEGEGGKRQWLFEPGCVRQPEVLCKSIFVFYEVRNPQMSGNGSPPLFQGEGSGERSYDVTQLLKKMHSIYGRYLKRMRLAAKRMRLNAKRMRLDANRMRLDAKSMRLDANRMRLVNRPKLLCKF